MKIKPQAAIIIVIAIFVVGIVAANLGGIWKTQSTKVPVKYRDEKLAEVYNPADIRGSYSFSEISSLFKIPLKDLADAFGLSEGEAANFKCKDLETKYAGSQYEIGTGSVKMFTAYYLGLPYTPSEETYLPGAALQVLKEKGKMTKEQLEYVSKHLLPAKQ